MRRTVDSMGRIVIPKSWRNDLHMDVNTQVEVTRHGSVIYVERKNRSCIFCGKEEELIPYNECAICQDCVHKILENQGRRVKKQDAEPV